MSDHGPLSGMFSAEKKLSMHRPGATLRLRCTVQSITLNTSESGRGMHCIVQGDPTIPLGAQMGEYPSGTLSLKFDTNYCGEIYPGQEFWLDLIPKEEFSQPRHSGWTMFMKRMGFAVHPGPLPFSTIRSQKWANYTWPGEIIEIHGEHGCDMKATPARVVSIKPFTGTLPSNLVDYYKGKACHWIELEPVDDEALARVGLRQSQPGGA